MKTERVKKVLQDLLVCPRCKSGLEIYVFLENEFGIEEGEMVCPVCKRRYLIKGGIIDLLSETKVIQQKGKPIWDMEMFDRMYKKLGVWKSGWEWDKIHGYPKEVSDYHCLRTKGALLSKLRPTAGSKILDVGCGTGYFLFDMIKEYPCVNMYLVGIDISQHNIECLVHRIKEERKTNILAIRGSAQELPFRNDTFDIVTCSEVLEHLYDPEGAIREINRVLKLGGRLLISTPSRTATTFWRTVVFPFRLLVRLKRRTLRFLRGRGGFSEIPLYNPPYDYPLYPKQLKALLVSNNFKILSFELNLIIPPKSLLRLIPDVIAVNVVKVCKIIERYMGTPFRFLALHSVVHCRKMQRIS